MEAQNLPGCACGTKRWSPAGSNIDSKLSQQRWCCDNCRRIALFISGFCCNSLVIPRAQQPGITQDHCDFVREALLYWPKYGREIRANQLEVEDAFRDRAMRAMDLDPDHGQVPEDRQAEFYAHFRKVYSSGSYSIPGWDGRMPIPFMTQSFMIYELRFDKDGEQSWERVRSARA